MGTNATSVDVMWLRSDATSAITYKVYRDGRLVQTTSTNRVLDTGLSPETTYTYTVTATVNGVESAKSSAFTVRTKSVAEVGSSSWDSRARYTKGDTVTFEGLTYQAVQSHTGNGDPSWITARSLWAPITAPMPMPMPAPAPAPGVNAWNVTGTYQAGDTVTFNGTTYRAVQSHTGNGDPNWIYALSLWAAIS